MTDVDIQRVGDSVLLVIDETQMLMSRDVAVNIGLALIKLGGALSVDTLDGCEAPNA